MGSGVGENELKKGKLTVVDSQHKLKPPSMRKAPTLLSSASSPPIARLMMKKNCKDKKTDVLKGASESTGASIVSNWIFAPFERLNHATSDFDVYASNPDNSTENSHYFGYHYGDQESKKKKALSDNSMKLVDGPKSELISKLMPHVVVSSASSQPQQSAPSLSMRPSFDSLSQFFDNSSNEPSPNVSPMPSPMSSPFLNRRLVSSDGTILGQAGLAHREISPLVHQVGQKLVNLDEKSIAETGPKHHINAVIPSATSAGNNDKKTMQPKTFKFNVENFDLNAVGPSSW